MRRIALATVFIVLIALFAGNSSFAQQAAVEVLKSDPYETIIRIRVADYSLEPVTIEGEQYFQMRLAGEGFTHTAGNPELPYITRSIIIPDDKHTAIELISARYEDIPLQIAPSKGILYRNTNPDDIPYTFSPVYEEDSFYPQHYTELEEPYIFRDFRGQTLKVYPFRYNPVRRMVRVFQEITVSITSSGAATANIKERQFDGYQPEFEAVYRSHFINFNSFQTATRNQPGRMLMIVYDTFVDATLPYLDWKIQKGVPATLHRVSQVGNTAAAIKTFILNQYNLNDGLTYVLLIGDHPQIPSFIVSGGGSDPTYSLLEGNDNYPEIFVGRFSGETADQIATQVNRSIHYEKNSSGIDTWFPYGTGIASSEGANPSDIQQMDSIRDRLMTYGYSGVDGIYAPNATAAQVTNAVNTGRSIINYAGHGTSTNWSTTGFSSTNINNLTNDHKLPFIISVACVNGNFTSRLCFAESWLRAVNNNNGNPTGAITVYASSINQAWYPPLTAQSEAVNIIVRDSLHTAGGILFGGAVRMIDIWGAAGAAEFRNWNIFGDASLIVRTKTPTAINVTHNGRMVIGEDRYTVMTNAPYARVALIDDQYALLASGTASAQGNIILNIAHPPDRMETLTLTVSAPHRTTHISQVEIASLPDHPYIMVNPREFSEVLMPDTLHSESLQIINRGDEDLYFTIAQTTAEPQRSLSGSWMVCSLPGFYPDSTYNWTMHVTNNAADEESISRIAVQFPEGIRINSVTPFTGARNMEIFPDTTAGENITITWQGEEEESIRPGEKFAATVNVTVNSDFEGDLVLPFSLVGDEAGEEPHLVQGQMLFYNEITNWLTLSPNEGLVAPGDTVTVAVNFSSYWCDEGFHARRLIIGSNDPLNYLTAIDVFFTVIDADSIYNLTVAPTELDSGGYYNSDIVYRFKVRNGGLVPDNFSFAVRNNLWNTTVWYSDGDDRNPDVLVFETGMLQPDESQDFLIKVRVPVNAPEQDIARLSVTSQGNPEREAVIVITTRSLGYDPLLPVPPARFIAEFEPMQAVLIRYPLGIPYSLIRDFAEHTKVYTVVANQTTLNQALTNYTTNGINTGNCEFIIAANNSFWIRDYGPWFVTTGTGEIAINDFTYNRSNRPSDNHIPSVIADYLDINHYLLPLIHTGGNIISNGMGKAASTNLVVSENTHLTTYEIRENAYNYLGVEDYLILPDPTGDNLRHIDTWAKFLDVDKIMLRSVPQTHTYYTQIEETAAYFENILSSYGTPWKIYRVYTPNNEPYVNSLIVNDRVYVPQMGNANDVAALQAYREAMPGYTVTGWTGDWRSNDAIHCRTNSIPDLETLYIRHIPPLRTFSGIETIIEAEIIPYSNQSVYEDSLYVYWKTEMEAAYNVSPMYHSSGTTYIASIDPQQHRQTVYYYIEAVDRSGRKETKPYIGGADPFSISINQIGVFGRPANITISFVAGDVVLSWDKVPYAATYIVEAAVSLDGEFTDFTAAGTFSDYPGKVFWTVPVDSPARFFRIKAARE